MNHSQRRKLAKKLSKKRKKEKNLEMQRKTSLNQVKPAVKSAILFKNSMNEEQSSKITPKRLTLQLSWFTTTTFETIWIN